MDDFYIFLVYLFYGGAFFAIGVSIISRDLKSSRLKIARILWVFALFAVIHGVHEWLEMFLRVSTVSVPDNFSAGAGILKLAMVGTSFLFLLLFGLAVFDIALAGRRVLLIMVCGLLTAFTLILLLRPWQGDPAHYLAWADYRIRNLIALPGALMAGIGLIVYSGTVRGVSRKGALNFTGAGISVIGYGIFTGIVPSGTFFFSSWLPVELFRGLWALAILHFMMHALYTFDTERQAAIEESLNRFVQSEKLSALGRLAAGIAHEINNPLANMSLNLEIIKRTMGEKGALPEYGKKIEVIERNLTRASRIASELLHVASEREPRPMETDLAEVVEGALKLLGPKATEYELAVDLNGVGPVRGVPWKLEEALLNVLINAMDATAPGGRISILARQEGTKALLEVADSGTGIAPEDLERVMEPFFTTKRVGEGTGLGLAICYGIMQMHGGDITITSRQGEGTTVTMSFPQWREGDESDERDPGG